MKIKLKIVIIIAVIYIITALFYLSTNAYSQSKYKILVDVEESRLYLFENNVVIKEYKCSRWQMEYPFTNRNMGNNSKGKMGRRLSDGSFMGINVPWGQFGIHGTLDNSSLGWASSHRVYKNGK